MEKLKQLVSLEYGEQFCLPKYGVFRPVHCARASLWKILRHEQTQALHLTQNGMNDLKTSWQFASLLGTSRVYFIHARLVT